MSSTCSRSPLAKASKKLVGMMAIRCDTTLSPLAAEMKLDTDFGSSFAGSMLKPAPGCAISATMSPTASASVETTSK